MTKPSATQRRRWLWAKPPRSYLTAELMRIIREVTFYSRGFRAAGHLKAQNAEKTDAHLMITRHRWSSGARPFEG